jgi:hypothetical protein
VWIKDFKSSPDEDDVEEDDVEMTGEDSGKVSRVDEDQFEKEIRVANETSVEEVRVSYVNPKTLDQLEEWMKEKPIPYISNDKFSQEDIFQYWTGRLQGHAHVNLTYPDVVDLKKKPMDKTLENRLKSSINTKLPTCDDNQTQKLHNQINQNPKKSLIC